MLSLRRQIFSAGSACVKKNKMANICSGLRKIIVFSPVLKSPTHIGFIGVKKNGSEISHLGTFKDDIKELCKNGVLSPGDSPYTSPMFYVLKKASDGKTAAKGRLCFDYRKINAMIKNKNFPLFLRSRQV